MVSGVIYLAVATGRKMQLLRLLISGSSVRVTRGPFGKPLRDRGLSLVSPRRLIPKIAFGAKLVPKVCGTCVQSVDKAV